MAEKQQQLIAVLEDTAKQLKKTQINIKKCPKARLTKGYLEARIKIVDEYWANFNNAHQQLVKITPAEQKGVLPYFLNEEFFIYEDLYNVIRGDLIDMQDGMSNEAMEHSYVSISEKQNHFVQLPRIQLSTFGGSYEDWPSFQDLFISLVHSNKTLSDVEKLHYLKTSVTGEAEALLKHIQVTSDNYSQAWLILKTRYGNKRLILNNNLKKLVNQRKMTTQSAVQLKALLDTTTECLHNIKNMKISVDSWDPLIIFLLVQKLDSETHKSWEEYAYKNDSEPLPKWNEFKEFLESKFRTLELLTTNTRDLKPIKERACHVATPTLEKICIMCKESHTLCHCKEFTKMEPAERVDYVKNKNLCYNCLVPGHSALKCRVPVSCRICHRRHHSLLHQQKQAEPAVSSSSSQPLASTQHVVEDIDEVQANTVIASQHTARQGLALLATAVVEARSNQGHIIPLRALIDQGSQASFISEKAAQLLKLDRQQAKGSVIGVGSTKTEIKHVVQLQVKSQWDTTFVLPIQAYVMSKQLTTKIPTKQVIKQPWPHLQGLQLADPTYHMSGPIDLLLGVREYASILQQEMIKGPPGTPCAQRTNLGWILFGEVTTKQEDTYLVMHHQVDVEEVLKSMWEIETDDKRKYTKEELQCEEIYKNTVTRNHEGRYVVKLPFKTENPRVLNGNTKEIAKNRFLQLERKFKRSPNLKSEYIKAINDYIEEGHVEIVPANQREDRSVYLPHHAVIREDKETTKTRVVFDASCKGSNNISLNDELLVGPQLQDDLRNLLMRWRMKRVCFVADVKKMYRQILVTKDDANYQRIFWRENETEDLKEYRLLRVTFGTAPAPYLAVKTLLKMAIDEEESQDKEREINKHKTIAIRTIKEDFYMDDLLSGASTEAEAISVAKEIMSILGKGGFELTKWSSNNIEFMKSIDEEKRSPNAHIELNLDGTIKALGIVWDLGADQFRYNLSLPPISKKITKRGILSDIQKLFDPLGWIAPSTVLAKILMQKLWLEKVSWDEEVSSDLQNEWQLIRTDFENVKDIRIDRWIVQQTGM